MADTSHLDAINLRLSHERVRVVEAKSASEREWREHNVRMIERERESEIAFLARQRVIISDPEPMTDEELLAELDEIATVLSLEPHP